MEADTEGAPENVDQPEEAVGAQRRTGTETGPFVLRSLLEDLPLSADGDRDDIEIKCVEFLGICLPTSVLVNN